MQVQQLLLPCVHEPCPEESESWPNSSKRSFPIERRFASSAWHAATLFTVTLQEAFLFQ